MKSEFSRNVVTLVTGTAIAQLIPILISPILTRIYSPEDFGVYAVYFSLLMILSVFASGKYEMAIVLPDNDIDAKRLVQICFFIATAVSVLLLLFLAIFLLVASLPESLEKAKRTLLILPVGVFLVGTSQALHYYNNRKGAYRKLAKSKVVRSISYSVTAIAGGFIKTPGIGLAIGELIGYLFNNAYLSIRKKNERLNLDWSEMKKLSKRYSNFPRYLIISGFFEKGSGQAPVLFINNLFQGTIQAGYFSFAQRIIITPADLIARAITDVFRQRASLEFIEHKNCYPLFKSTFKKLFLIAVIPFTIAYFAVVDIFAFVFGNEWAVAGQYAQIMMPMFFLQFIVSPLSIVFMIAEKQKYDLVLQITLLFGVSASFLIGHFIYGNIETSIKLFTMVYCTKYVVELYLAYQFSQGK
jgi:O-antigen/teichoic acid export membrane protein